MAGKNKKYDEVVVTAPISGEELIRRFLSVIEQEAATNPRFKRSLIRELCGVAVAVPPEEADRGLWDIMRRVPW